MFRMWKNILWGIKMTDKKEKAKLYRREYMRFYYRVKSIFNNIHKYNLTEEEQRKLIDIARTKDVFVTHCEIAELRKNV